MENYSFWADVLTTFRSSSDLVKVIWLLAPIIFLLGLVYAFLRLFTRKPAEPKLPLLSFNSPEHGLVTVYRSETGIELMSVDEFGKLLPLLSLSKDIAKRIDTSKPNPMEKT